MSTLTTTNIQCPFNLPAKPKGCFLFYQSSDRHAWFWSNRGGIAVSNMRFKIPELILVMPKAPKNYTLKAGVEATMRIEGQCHDIKCLINGIFIRSPAKKSYVPNIELQVTWLGANKPDKNFHRIECLQDWTEEKCSSSKN